MTNQYIIHNSRRICGGFFFSFLPFLLFPDVILDEFSESQRSRDEATGSSAVAMLTRSSEASLRGERRRRLNTHSVAAIIFAGEVGDVRSRRSVVRFHFLPRKVLLGFKCLVLSFWVLRSSSSRSLVSYLQLPSTQLQEFFS